MKAKTSRLSAFRSTSIWIPNANRTIPDALLKPRKREPLQAARAVSAEAVDSIKLNAQRIEDAILRDALLSLANSLAENVRPENVCH